MHTLKPYQEKAVGELLEYTCQLLSPDETRRRIPLLLKAPTGAGKTVTMAAFISRLLAEVRTRPGLPGNLAFIWLAPNTLHLQSYAALSGFYSALHDLRTLQLSDLSGSSMALNPNELLFVNWSSLDKEKNLFRKDNEQGANLPALIENTRNTGSEIIVVIDEAHLSATTGKQAKKVLEIIRAKLEISVTATPLEGQPYEETVKMRRQDVIAAKMIKKGVHLNIDLSEKEQQASGEQLDVYLLRRAMAKRDELAAAYQALGIDINPLLLIQLPSDKTAITAEDESKRKVLEGYLDGDFGITTNNGQLAVWLSDSKDKINLDGIERPNAPQKVLIFKQAISQGWDCPRAAVLIVYREIGSETFAVQTVGRILRMPQQRHYPNDLLNHGYVYTNLQNRFIKFLPEESDYFSRYVAQRREGLAYQSLKTSFIINDRPAPGYLNPKFTDIFFQVVEELYSIKEIPEQTLFSKDEEEKIAAHTEVNRKAFRQRLWQLDLDEVQISVPADLYVNPYETGGVAVDNAHTKRFIKTQKELTEMLNAFCYRQIAKLNRSKSYPVLRDTLIEFSERFLGLIEFDARKLLLAYQNEDRIKELIQLSLERFDEWQRAKGNTKRRVDQDRWELPQTRIYNEIYEEKPGPTHALDPYYERSNASTVEQQFRETLEKHPDQLAWWYKNGDSGKEHFAIDYGDKQLFYVDFIVKFAYGTVGLFDTKTKGSDPFAVEKHNALIAYCEVETAKGGPVYIGSLMIPEDKGGLRYCRNRITSTKDLMGWEFFNPADFNS